MMEVLPTHSYTFIESEVVKAIVALDDATPRAIAELLTERSERPVMGGMLVRKIAPLIEKGLIADDGGTWKLTELGWASYRPACSKVRASDFSPYEDLIEHLLPFASDGTDAAHDLSHILRVWRNAQRIQQIEGGDPRIVVAAVLLHDAINVEKSSPARSMASRLSGELAVGLLTKRMGWPIEDAEQVRHAVEAHSHSAGIVPLTLEAKIVQDADRLDALGCIGMARCFHVSGRIGRPLYDAHDPTAQNRPLDDIAFAMDHFERKLFGLHDRLNTETARALGEARTSRLRDFYDGFMEEIGESSHAPAPLAHI